jgi:hypothetical protein
VKERGLFKEVEVERSYIGTKAARFSFSGILIVYNV